ncbi:MAG: metallophosphoesterase [Acidobacteria bacterium]|nr:metallophosphoesterase [Acidobacteriota bacterium]
MPTPTLIPRPQLLVVSDIQFGEFGRCKLLDRSYPAICKEATQLAEELLQACSHLKPHLLVLAGDITSKGDPAEFQAARVFVDRLLDPQGGFSPRGLVVCPGNHDVDLSRLDNHLRFSGFCDFADALYRDYGDKLVVPDHAPWRGNHENVSKLWSAFDFEPTLNLLVICLNSAEKVIGERLIGVGDGTAVRIRADGGAGHVSKAQLQEVEGAIGLEKLRSTPTVAVLHHNLVHGRKHPKLAAAGQVVIAENYLEIVACFERWHVDVVIHGHQHEPYASFHQFYDSPEMRAEAHQPMRGVLLVGVGSFAACKEELPEGTSNHFQTLRLDTADPTTRQIAECQTYWRVPTSGEGGSWSPRPAQALMWPEAPPEWEVRFHALEPGRPLFVSARDFADGLDRLLSVLSGIKPFPLFVSVLAGSPDAPTQTTSTLSALEESVLKDVLYAAQTVQIFEQAMSKVSVRNLQLDSGRLAERLEKEPWLSAACLQLSPIFLGGTSEVFEVAAWFDRLNTESIGIGCVVKSDEDARMWRRSSLPLALGRVVRTLDRFWSLRKVNSAFDGVIADEFFAPLDCSTEPSGELAADFQKARDDVFAGGAVALTAECYGELEPILYRAKRLIERAVLFAIIDGTELDAEYLDQTVSSLARSVQWRGERRGLVIDPLLVSFWLPPTSLPGAPEDSGLRWIPTRDQVLYILGPYSPGGYLVTRLDMLRELLTFDMRSYSDQVFEGIAAYVYATGKAVSSSNAYAVKLTTGRALLGAKNVPNREARAELRQKISEIERDFWMEGANGRHHAALVIPLWGGTKVEAVLSLQTASLDANHWMASAGVLEALRSMELPLELLRNRNGKRRADLNGCQSDNSLRTIAVGADPAN